MLANYLLNLSRVFLCDTLYYAIMSMKMTLHDNKWRAHVNLSCDYFNVLRILSSIIWTQNSTGTECLLLSHLQEKNDFPIFKVCISLLLTLRLVRQPLKDFSAIFKTPNLLRKTALTTNRSML